MHTFFMGFLLSMPQTGSAFTPTVWDAGYTAFLCFRQVMGWAICKNQIETMCVNIDFCIANNTHVFTPESRQWIQQLAERNGVTVPVTAITGFQTEDNEAMCFQAMTGRDNVLYVNIQWSWVYFLNNGLKKMNNKEELSEVESAKMNTLSFLVTHEMNHVKKIVAGTSIASRKYPLKRVCATVALQALAGIYLAHEYQISYTAQFLPVTLLMISAEALYAMRRHCNEEYACDIEGMEDPALLRAGKEWLLTDAQEYVDRFFSQDPEVEAWYKKYPNVFCSVATDHPHPVARAAAIARKIAELEAEHINTQEIAITN
jgi:hypothetical protein